jgi:formate dehydrogenase subunit gamma
MTTRLIHRYDAAERRNHWVVAILFFLAALSGLAFFHPSLFFLSNLFGGGAWTRILHPFIGVLMCVFFVGMYLRYRGDNKMTELDREWLKHARELMRGDKSKMPPVGKYNAGQKRLFWALSISLAVLVITGFMFWRPWFAGYFPVDLVRAASLLHAVAALVLVLAIILHIYAAFWTKGSIRGMTRGTVTEAWARQNHALWHKEVTQGK